MSLGNLNQVTQDLQKQNWYEVELKKEALQKTLSSFSNNYGNMIVSNIKQNFIFSKEQSYEENMNRIREKLKKAQINEGLIDDFFSEYQKNINTLNDMKYGNASFFEIHQFEREYANGEPWEIHLKRLFDMIKTKKSDIILNVGINDGKEMEGIENKIIGIDLSEKALRNGKANYKSITFMEGSANSLPISSESVDMYLSLRTLCITGVYESIAVSEAKRVLKPDGRILISIPSVQYDKGDILLKGKYNLQPFKTSEISGEILKYYNLLEKKGFVDLQIFRNGVEDFIYGVKK